MKRLATLLTAVVTLFVAACGGQSQQTTDQYVVLGKGDGTIPAVQLIHAESWNQIGASPKNKQKAFVVRVRNLAFEKSVAIHHRTKSGQWVDLPAKYVGPADAEGNTELWKASTLSADFDGQFVIKYSVGGLTYWDNNNGRDYTLGDEDGPMLGTGIHVRQYSPASLSPEARSFMYRFRGVIDVRNIGPAKNVTVHYSYDNWASTRTVEASYMGPWRTSLYSTIANPNVHNVEGWEFSELIVAQNSKVEYYISYEVNGQTYTDNNYGKNYVAEWKSPR
jgi:hypothetical protein